MKVKQLNVAHQDHDLHRLARLRALAEGGKRWHELAETWHPRRAMEPPDVYKERHTLLTYTNHAGGLVEMFSGLLFAEAPQVNGLPAEGSAAAFWQAFAKSCNGAGTPWERWWRERVVDALIGGRTYAWVNLPARPDGWEAGSLAEEQAAGLLDAYLVPLQAEQVINWTEDARGQLTGVMVRDVNRAWKGPDEGVTVTWRWRFIDAKQVRTWEWKGTERKQAPNPDDVANELAPAPHGLGVLPVVRLQLPSGLWAMNKLEDPCVRADRARNDHSWALHQAANELLTITSASRDEAPVLGHGYYLRLGRDQAGEDKAGYVAPTGVAFQFLQQDVADTREEVYRVVQQMALSADSDATRARMSGESKAQDWHAVDIILAALADPVLDAMAATLRLVGRARGERELDISLTGLDGWQTETTEAFLQSALVADGLVKSPTFKRTVAKRVAERLLQDEVDAETLDAIRTELDEADYEPPELDYAPPGAHDVAPRPNPGTAGRRPGAPGA